MKRALLIASLLAPLAAAGQDSNELGLPSFADIALAIAFADPSFHLGWAEITLGWLIALAARQLPVIIEATEFLPVSDERRQRYEALRKQVNEALARHDRCRIEEVEDRGDRRYLVHNFRRAASASPKKILL